MRRLFTAISLLALALGGTSQTTIPLESEMGGTLELDNGETVFLWGYSFQGPSPLTLPAPTLEIPLNEEVTLDFFNNSGESHTIHLHGLDVNQVNDGVPQTSFYVFGFQSAEYVFNATHTGTFLYHCHVTTTLHLTMGMYGMIVVHHPDQLLYDNGPGYNKEVKILTSDLDISVNQEPLSPGPLNEIQPDYFMVNGLAGNQLLSDTSHHVYAEANDSIVLRIGSMAYSTVRYTFPSGSNPTVYMSDGRQLPQSFETNELEVYPGERFSVILRPDEFLAGDIEVDYFNGVNGEWVGNNIIPVHHVITQVEEEGSSPEFSLLATVVTTHLAVNAASDGAKMDLYDVSGRKLQRWRLTPGLNKISVAHLPAGIYILNSGNWSASFIKE
jgi:FtsP/CotA-like multicopper oxidase with cupredoxin domain